LKSRNYFIVVMLLISFNSKAFEVTGVLDWSVLSVKSFYMQGTVKSVFVNSGEQIKKDQLLAQLDRRSLSAVIEKHKARVQQLEPLIFDAQVEFNNAEELYERTVLSEVDLQKKQGSLKRFKAQQAVALADLKIAKIKYQDAQLKASQNARVVQVDLIPGLVISEENMSAKKIILARLGEMLAKVIVTVDQATEIYPGQEASLKINGDKYKGIVTSSKQQIDHYIVNVKFKYNEKTIYLAGKKVSVEF